MNIMQIDPHIRSMYLIVRFILFIGYQHFRYQGTLLSKLVSQKTQGLWKICLHNMSLLLITVVIVSINVVGLGVVQERKARENKTH